MFRRLTTICLLTAVSVAGPATAGSDCEQLRQNLDTDWVKTHETRGATVFRPRQPRAGEMRATAVVTWPFPPARLFREVGDYARFPEFIPGVLRSTVLRKTNRRVWVYQRLAFPSPLHDRHYVMVSDSSASEPQDAHYRIGWQLDPHFTLPAQDTGLVRPEKFDGCWDIRRLPTRGLTAIYSITLKPGGLVPAWLARRGTRDYVAHLMQALYRHLERQNTGPSEQ